jgi:hypothetical protein
MLMLAIVIDYFLKYLSLSAHSANIEAAFVCTSISHFESSIPPSAQFARNTPPGLYRQPTSPLKDLRTHYLTCTAGLHLINRDDCDLFGHYLPGARLDLKKLINSLKTNPVIKGRALSDFHGSL